jgi:hypothetical protein
MNFGGTLPMAPPPRFATQHVIDSPLAYTQGLRYGSHRKPMWHVYLANLVNHFFGQNRTVLAFTPRRTPLPYHVPTIIFGLPKKQMVRSNT